MFRRIGHALVAAALAGPVALSGPASADTVVSGKSAQALRCAAIAM